MDVSPPPPPESADLAFDRAEPAAASASAGSCATCNNALAGEYWASSGRTLCAACAEQIKRHNQGKPGLRGFLKAGLFGSVAALLGWGVYYLVSLSGWEFGLIAILVGFAVGHAVRIGSGGYGGLSFQLLAMALTYLAIAGTYAPYILDSILQPEVEEAGADGAATADDDGAVPEATPAQTAPRVEAQLGHYVFAFVFSLAAPFLAGFENIMGILILAIGLWEAWKIPRRVEVELLGPYTIASSAPAAAA